MSHFRPPPFEHKSLLHPPLLLKMTSTSTVTQAAPITAQNILQLFPDIDTSSAELDGHDEEQIRLMDEVCIVTDENDKPIGNFSKKICE
jgi:isopentenyl-diphosphate delta-isomerase